MPAVSEYDLRPPVSDAVTYEQPCVLYYYPLYPLSHPAQNLIRDRPRILRHFLRPDHAVPRPPDEHHFIPAPCVRHISYVQSELIHADAPDDRNTLPIDKGMSPVGKAARDPISIAGGDDGDPPRVLCCVGETVSSRFSCGKLADTNNPGLQGQDGSEADICRGSVILRAEYTVQGNSRSGEIEMMLGIVQDAVAALDMSLESRDPSGVKSVGRAAEPI